MDDDEVVRPKVARNRMAYTVVSSICGNGDPGPIAVHYAEDAGISQAAMQELNSDYKGRLRVCSSMLDTHFMNAESTVRYWEGCLTPAFERRRSLLGMTDDSRAGALLFDKFTGNDAETCGHKRRPDMWLRKNHVIMLDAILGGGSAKGQPCDGAHAHFRRLTIMVKHSSWA